MPYALATNHPLAATPPTVATIDNWCSWRTNLRYVVRNGNCRSSTRIGVAQTGHFGLEADAPADELVATRVEIHSRRQSE